MSKLTARIAELEDQLQKAQQTIQQESLKNDRLLCTVGQNGAELLKLRDQLQKEQAITLRQARSIDTLRNNVAEKNRAIQDLVLQNHSLVGDLQDVNDCCRDYKEENLRLQEIIDDAEGERELREYADNLLDTIASKENTINSMDGAIGDLCKLCLDRYNEIQALKKLLGEGCVLVENTIRLLEAKKPMMDALARARRDGTVAQCIDDAEFLNSLTDGGGDAIVRLVRAVLA